MKKLSLILFLLLISCGFHYDYHQEIQIDQLFLEGANLRIVHMEGDLLQTTLISGWGNEHHPRIKSEFDACLETIPASVLEKFSQPPAYFGFIILKDLAEDQKPYALILHFSGEGKRNYAEIHLREEDALEGGVAGYGKFGCAHLSEIDLGEQ